MALAGLVGLAMIAGACGSDASSDPAPAGSNAAEAPTDTSADSVAANASGNTTAATSDSGVAAGAVFDQTLADLVPQDVRDAGVLTLATDPTDPPLEFFDESNEIVGAEIDVAAALGVVLGLEVKIVQSKFDAIIPGVEAGRFDGSLSGFADRVERQELVDFVDFYTTSRGYLIKTGTVPELADATELCGYTVAVAKGTTMADAIGGLNDTCVADGKDAIESQIFPDQAAGVLAVQSGRADLTILSGHASLAIAQSSGGELDVILRPEEGKDVNGILLRKGDLVESVQPAMQQLMDNGTLLDIMTKWNLQDIVLDEATVNAGTN